MKFLNGQLPIKVRISKAFEEKTSFCLTYPDDAGETRSVRTVRVIAANDVSPKSVEDIEKVVPWTQAQRSYEYCNEEGVRCLLPVDEYLTKMNTKSETMTILGIVDASSITPRMYDGNHYFLSVQVDSKSKKSGKADRQGYTLLHYICTEERKNVLVKFLSGEREKFAVIYADGEGLMMSLLLHSTYQRDAPEHELEVMSNPAPLAAKLIKAFGLRSVDPDMIEDTYESTLKGYLEELQELAQEEAKTDGPVPKGKPVLKKKIIADPDDFFAQVDLL